MATIFGTNGNNVLNGGAENDIIFARGGADTVSGGDGDDAVLFEISPAGSDYFDGGTGDDGVLLDVGLGQFDISPSPPQHQRRAILLDTVAGVTLTVTDVEKIGFSSGRLHCRLRQRDRRDPGCARRSGGGRRGPRPGRVLCRQLHDRVCCWDTRRRFGQHGRLGKRRERNVFSLAGNLGAGNAVALENIAVTGGENGIRIASNTQLGVLGVSNMEFSGLSAARASSPAGGPGSIRSSSPTRHSTASVRPARSLPLAWPASCCSASMAMHTFPMSRSPTR